MGFGDFSLSMLMRDTIERIVKETIELSRPRYRYAVVNTIDRLNYKCIVTYNGESNPVTVSMGSVQPSIVGQTVRVEGIGTDKFIADIVGESSGITPVGVILEFGGLTAPVGFVMADGASYLRTALPALFVVYGTTHGAVDGTHFNVPDRRRLVGVGRGDAVSLGAATTDIASQVTVTRAAHGLADGQQVRFTTTGALPTGLVVGTRYYVRDASATQFHLAATLGGASITTSGSQSGVHTLWSADFEALGQTGGEANHRLTTAETAAHTHPVNVDGSINGVNWQGTGPSGAQFGFNPDVVNVASGIYPNLARAAGLDQPHLNLQPQIVLNYIIKI